MRGKGVMDIMSNSRLRDIFINDIELFGLMAGLRPVAKKEGPDAERLMAMSDELMAAGFTVVKNDLTGCAYVSQDRDAVARLVELENREFSGGNPELRAQTIYEIGLMLGYPDCCAKAFSSHRMQDDTHVMAEFIAQTRATHRTLTGDSGSTVITLPWQLNFLVPMTGPVFYYPCTADCPASLTLANRYLAALELARPGATEQMKQILAHPVLVAGRWDFVVFDGSADQEGTINFTSWRTAADYHPVPAPSPQFTKFISELPQQGHIKTANLVLNFK